MDAASIAEISDLDGWLAERNLAGSWQRWPSRGPTRAEPGSAAYPPYLWQWADVYQGLMMAGRIVSMDQTGELAGRLAGRKNLGLVHPGMPRGAAPTIGLGAQILMPGEIAEAHRHTQAGLRFVVKGGPDACMVVEGERFPMEDGDLITTPAWAWHDYYNSGPEPVFWLDGLDIPLIRLAHPFREIYSQEQQPITRADGYSAKTLGRARAPWLQSELPTPPLRYPWTETYAALQALKEAEANGDPCDGLLLTYSHPLTGGPTTPTMSAQIQLLTPHLVTRAHRHNCTTRYHVVRGEGATIVDGERLEWTQGDLFLLPPWAWHHHENHGSGDAILFSVTDKPTMVALEFYREESA